MIFDRVTQRLMSPWKTSTKVVLKFMVFSAGILFVGLLILQGWYFHRSMKNKEMLLVKRAEKAIEHGYFRHRNDGIVLTKEQQCFLLYRKEFCLDGHEKKFLFKDIYEIDHMYFLVKMIGEKKVVQDVTGMVETMEHIMQYALWIFLVYLLVSYPLGVLFLKTIYSKLFQAMKHLEYDEMIDIDGMQLASHDEIRHLFERINTSMDSIKQFNSYVSHEVKTPLMMASSHLDVINAQIQKKQYTTISTKIPQIQQNLQEVAEIVDVLGKFILIENKAYPEERKDMKCCEAVSWSILSYEKQINKGEITFDISCEGVIQTNPILFKLLLRNLIDNAVKYSAPSGREKNKKVFIQSDTKGLRIKNFAKKPENLAALTEKFYKEGSESGLGLGLYLVQKIVKLLGWKMFVAWEKGEFEVNVIFP